MIYLISFMSIVHGGPCKPARSVFFFSLDFFSINPISFVHIEHGGHASLKDPSPPPFFEFFKRIFVQM